MIKAQDVNSLRVEFKLRKNSEKKITDDRLHVHCKRDVGKEDY